MVQAAKRETQEQQAAQWTAERISEMRTDAIVAANKLHYSRWGVYVPALTAAIAARS